MRRACRHHCGIVCRCYQDFSEEDIVAETKYFWGKYIEKLAGGFIKEWVRVKV